MTDTSDNDDSKLTRTKRSWAQEGRFLTGHHGSDRLPPGQHVVTRWPVLDLGRQPDISSDTWKLEVHGLVSNPVSFDWAGFSASAEDESVSDIHCVTTWSLYDKNGAGCRPHGCSTWWRRSPRHRRSWYSVMTATRPT